jgi:hypothetical protein
MFKSPPNDQFDPDSYCHSPWFEKCCGEKRSVAELKRHGDLDDIYLKIMPRKTAIAALATSGTSGTGTLHSPGDTISGGGGGGTGGGTGGLVLVSQLDLESTALQLETAPALTFTPPQGAPQDIVPTPPTYLTHLPLLVLFKV